MCKYLIEITMFRLLVQNIVRQCMHEHKRMVKFKLVGLSLVAAGDIVFGLSVAVTLIVHANLLRVFISETKPMLSKFLPEWLMLMCAGLIFISLKFIRSCLQGEWKPKQIPNPNYKGPWIHPEIDNPEYSPDDNLYLYKDFGALGFDLWQVR